MSYKVEIIQRKDPIVQLEAIKSIKAILPETMKYWVGVQRGQSYLMGRRCLFSLGWQPF